MQYFDKSVQNKKEFYQAKPLLKQLIKFRQFNLMDQFQFKRPFDIIFCRNVMIYFDKQTQQMLVDKFVRNLTPGGLLFVGHSESLTGIKHTFRYVEPTIYQKAQ